jgi:hypothetical protein
MNQDLGLRWEIIVSVLQQYDEKDISHEHFHLLKECIDEMYEDTEIK